MTSEIHLRTGILPNISLDYGEIIEKKIFVCIQLIYIQFIY